MVDVVYKKDGQNRAHRVTKDEFLSMVQDPSISFSSIDLELVLRVFSTVGEAVEFLNSGGFPWSVNGIRAGCSLGPYRTGLVNYAWDEGCAECKCSGFHYDSLDRFVGRAEMRAMQWAGKRFNKASPTHARRIREGGSKWLTFALVAEKERALHGRKARLLFAK